jgi:hypothetical protein
MITGVIGHRLARVFSAALLGVSLAGSAALAGCSGEGASATCDGTTSCTITFERKASPTSINVLGVKVSLESATADTITLKVGDKDVTLNKSDSTTVAGLTFAVDNITDTQVVVKVSRS